MGRKVGETERRILEFLKEKGPTGATAKEIAKALNISIYTAKYALDKLEIFGKVMRIYGRAAVSRGRGRRPIYWVFVKE